ncbi:HEAT repeat domain-containing protein [Roseofilum sp. BLCC_M154]|uniref:HEAT repeat domain-containing protein n=1 Tax=Roseofilum acuticapitatum BLCC-M154 TaxID=3022444 RepID=A0ABT7ANB6_9CYAN|nr:HEAT repeat domain-containing protein [Roseofilum acuticapitatum]MDJ1168385.1 HEAT repeat domain-containing protein [Roseofilum acuticapitatum BLCC-M154]
MELHQIQTALNSSNSQDRLRAVTALKDHSSEDAVPLLMSKINDPDFLVRSFVAMGLGRKQSPDSFPALLELLKRDPDPNVRSEAANALSYAGQVAISHLVIAFHQDDHWLLRRSIIAALADLGHPEALLEVCLCGLDGDDITVTEASIEGLACLANTPKQQAALNALLPLITSPQWRIRRKVAWALQKFADSETTQEALQTLSQDQDHRVVAALLENRLSQDAERVGD